MRPCRHLRGEQGYSLVELMIAVALLVIAGGAVFNVYRTSHTIALTGENKAEAQQGARGGILQIEEELRLTGYGYPPANTAFASASTTSVSFWADLTNTSTTLSAAVNSGGTAFTINPSPGTSIAVGDQVYLINQGQADPVFTVSAVSGNTITVSGAGASTGYPIGSMLGRPRQITYAYNGTNTVTRDPGDGTGAQTAFTGVSAFSLTYFDNTDTQIAAANLAANLANIRRVVISMTVQSTAALNRGTFSLSSSVRPRNVSP
jgi:prepilin-type N-terminal cleavage/methylation domain-containing protein